MAVMADATTTIPFTISVQIDPPTMSCASNILCAAAPIDLGLYFIAHATTAYSAIQLSSLLSYVDAASIVLDENGDNLLSVSLARTTDPTSSKKIEESLEFILPLTLGSVALVFTLVTVYCCCCRNNKKENAPLDYSTAVGAVPQKYAHPAQATVTHFSSQGVRPTRLTGQTQAPRRKRRAGATAKSKNININV
jgi:hypothetical protein